MAALIDETPIGACVKIPRNTVKRKIASAAHLTSEEYKHIDAFAN